MRTTTVRLNNDHAGRCCSKCGLIESVVTPLEVALGAENGTEMLPNMLGALGESVSKDYRRMYGAEAPHLHDREALAAAEAEREASGGK